MKWIEMIEFRSVNDNRELLESRLQELMNDVDKETNTQAITAYRRVMIDTDVSIHQVHDSTNE